MFGIEEAVKEAQAGGSGVVIYFRKEGRALGEVTKYLVYNVRKRTGDRASEYFERTEGIAGVKDVPRLPMNLVLTVDAIPSFDAGYSTLVGNHKDRSNVVHVKHEVRRYCRPGNPHPRKSSHPRLDDSRGWKG